MIPRLLSYVLSLRTCPSAEHVQHALTVRLGHDTYLLSMARLRAIAEGRTPLQPDEAGLVACLLAQRGEAL